MYLLANQVKGDFLKSNTTNKLVFLPQLWSASIEDLNLPQKAANAIFLNKQIAFMVKHYNKLEKEWVVIPVENYLGLKQHVEIKDIGVLYNLKFAFVLAMHNGLRNISVYSNVVSFDDLLSGQDWETPICKRFPAVTKLLELDKQTTYEEAEEKAKKIVIEYKDSDEF